jgi:hypothetical protein
MSAVAGMDVLGVPLTPQINVDGCASSISSPNAVPVLAPRVVLTDDQLVQLADLLADRLRSAAEPAPTPMYQLVDAKTLAQELSVSTAWVYRHADMLGATRLGPIGKHKRPRLRFDASVAQKAMRSSISNDSQAKTPVNTGDSRPSRARPRRSPKPAPVVGHILGSRPRKPSP